MGSIRKLKVVRLAFVPFLAGCGLSALIGPPEPGPVRLSVTSARIAGTLQREEFRITATLVNDTDSQFLGGGCDRPTITIETESPTGWVQLDDAIEVDDGIRCLVAFSLSARSSISFESVFRRTAAGGRFPRDVPLRLQVYRAGRGLFGPTATVTLTR